MSAIWQAAILLLLSSAVLAESVTEYRVNLSNEAILVGKNMESRDGRTIKAFLGVPYAQPPVGDLRFKAPLPSPLWKGERKAMDYAERCLQENELFLELTISGSEDCLYLNVFVPEKPATNDSLPVMVWIYGGGLISGESNTYGPAYILDRDVVLVTLNYRVGALGFLSSETTDCPGNFGLKDQNLALRWVKEHISAFGGNPNSVTIFGESAGAASVSMHMLSEKSKGLFHKAILESGSYTNPYALQKTPGIVADYSKRLVEIVGCDTEKQNWTTIMECLRKKDAVDIQAALPKLRDWFLFPLSPLEAVLEPEHDEAFLPAIPSPDEPQHSDSIPILIGANADEGLLFTARIASTPTLYGDLVLRFNSRLPIALDYQKEAADVQKDITKQIKDFYYPNGVNLLLHYQNFTDVVGDVWITKGVDDIIRGRVQKQVSGSTYVYRFDHKGLLSASTLLTANLYVFGTSHGDDLLYLFPFTEKFLPIGLTGNNLELSKHMVDLWVNFASEGNPTPKGSFLPTWTPADSYPPQFLRIGNGKNTSETNLLIMNEGKYPVERMEFWRQIEKIQHE